MSNSLRYQVVKLAKENPQLRGHLLPLVTGKTANNNGLRLALTKLAYENPSIRSAVLPLVKTSGAFEDSVKGKKFKNPDTGNQVEFGSLPSKEQEKIRKEFSKGSGKSEDKKEDLHSNMKKMEKELEELGLDPAMEPDADQGIMAFEFDGDRIDINYKGDKIEVFVSDDEGGDDTNSSLSSLDGVSFSSMKELKKSINNAKKDGKK